MFSLLILLPHHNFCNKKKEEIKYQFKKKKNQHRFGRKQKLEKNLILADRTQG